MLTMPKVIAGAIMAFLAWIVSGQVKVEMLAVHGSYNFGWFVTLSVVIGFLCGYGIIGSRANGRMGFAVSVSVGLTAAAATVFWVLLLVSLNEMLRLAFARRFDGPTEALLSIVPIAGDYGQYLLHTNIILTLAIGGMLAGWVADIAARRWK
ncbi:TrgA family protein [Pseudooceanicola sp.]|jgi:hypothetical protein|uniref:TrgA family protein n=1 Tax=Pseudooceanicola sp. TaxID=1914328 RepID=UPI004058401F